MNIIHEHGRYSMVSAGEHQNVIAWYFCIDGHRKFGYGTKECPTLETAIRDYRKGLESDIKHSKERVAYHSERDKMLTQELKELEKDYENV
ncbi:hypothetical protein phiAS5_ORF0242 [Aeromonas phage phiAS5]|uniref:Uncharacterized protein n=1 Tax=Aeromonas phage phiAS5 TaxID=879630 RepID=E1A1Z6_9CAUD|nr:hypothetical protein phiAS5_ORF0242 [Aeromonas phage phiAS5]ADM80085.1 hypothetical protein phiAS5_ORF0242 [Aeromonas phage phiAS5]